MKNGRFSGKKVSKAVRFTTAGSTSTCPKSGLKVASRVRFEVSRYLRSAPARASVECWRENGSGGDPPAGVVAGPQPFDVPEPRGASGLGLPPERPHRERVEAVLVAPHLPAPGLHRVAREAELREGDPELRGP